MEKAKLASKMVQLLKEFSEEVNTKNASTQTLSFYGDFQTQFEKFSYDASRDECELLM